VDRARDNVFVGNPVPLHKVGETADSIVVRGCRLLATLAPYADEQTVYPSTPLPPDAADYALAFTIRMDAPGLVFLCRDSGIRPDAHPLDAPFSTRFDEQDALCIFDDVEIPKENVFIDGNLEVYNHVLGRSMWWPNITHQTTIRALTKLEFAYGLLVRMAAAVNDTSERTTELLGEVLGYVEVTRNAILLAELNAQTWEGGGVYPEGRALHPMRALLPDWFARINEIFKIVGSHNLLAASSRGALDDPRINALVNEFQPGANDISADDRSAVYRVAWDFMGSLLGARNELYERNYLASARTNRMMCQILYSEAARRRGDELLEKLLADARAR
jgi:aromatic ring hydroxylase